MKNPVLLLLLSFFVLTTVAQRPDSVQLNGKWHFVYPMKMKMEPTGDYLAVAGLTSTEFEQYRDWVQAGDQRLNLEKDSLIKALRASILDDKILTFEQYENEKDGYKSKSIYAHRCYIRTTHRNVIRRFIRGAVRTHHGSNKYMFSVRRRDNKKDLRKALLKTPQCQFIPLAFADYSLPPCAKNLPDGDYVLYYDDFFSVDQWKKWKLNPQQIAVVFSMKNNLLTGNYKLFAYDGEMLVNGTYEDGLREGSWMVKKESHTRLDYKEGWCFNRKYVPPKPNVDSLVLHYNYDLLHGDCSSFERWFSKTYSKHWEGHFENGLPKGEWYHTFMSDVNFKGDLQPGSKAFEKNYANSWTTGDLPLSDSLYTFSKLETPYSYRDLWKLETAACMENTGMASLSKIEGNPLRDFVQTDYAKGANVIYLSFENYCELWSDGQDSTLVARFYRDKIHQVIVGSRYFENGALYDTCGFNEQGQLVHKQFDATGKLYATSFYSEKGKLIRTDYTTPKDQLMIDGYAVKVSYSKEFYWEGDTLVPGKRLFEMRWNKHKRLIEENYYDQQLQQFVEKSFDENTGKLLVTKLIPYTREALSKIDSAYAQPGSKNTTKATYLRERYMKFDTYQRQMVWDELTFVEDSDAEKSKVTLLVNGQPYTGELEIRFHDKRYDRYKMKGGKLVIELYNRNGYNRRKRDHIPRWIKKKISGTISNEIIAYTPHLFQLKLNAPDGYNQLRDGIVFYTFCSGTMKEGIPGGEWMFLNGAKKVMAEMSYTGQSSTGFLFAYRSQFSDSKDEAEEYKTDPLKQQYEPACKKFTSYLYRKTPIANRHEEGVAVTYNHVGDTLAIKRFHEGKLHGDQLILTSQDDDGKRVFHIGKFDAGIPVGKQVVVSKKYRSAVGGGKWRIDTIAVVNYVNGKREGKAHYSINNFHFYDLAFANDKPAVEMTITNRQKDTVEHYTFQDGFVDRMQYFKENTLSYEYNLPEKDSIKLDLTSIYELDRIPSEDPNIEYLYDYHSPPLFAYDDYIGRDEVPNSFVFTKFYPNGIVARTGELIHKDEKTGRWSYASPDQTMWYTIDYNDSIYIQNGDTFSIIGVQTQLNVDGQRIKKQLVLEEKDFYKCTSDEYYSIREYLVPESPVASEEALNYYDNGTLMSRGQLINGLPDGLWQFYNQQGGLTRTGIYKNGKKIGRWLEGDLNTKAYLGDICLDESNPDLDVIVSQLERGKKIDVTIYRNGKAVSKQTYESSK